MISADETLFEANIRQREAEIKMQEMSLFAGHLGVISTSAAFLAEQAAEGLLIMPENVAKTANNSCVSRAAHCCTGGGDTGGGVGSVASARAAGCGMR